MNKNNQHLEFRLQVWADWCSSGIMSGLGYPPKSWEAKLIEHGGIWVKGCGQPVLLCNAQAEEIEDWINILAQEHYFLAQVLRECYLGDGSMVQKARRLDMSYRHFKNCVDKAKMWLAGRLSSHH